MNYELSKKLKDAGFPQEGKGESFESEENRLSRENMNRLDSIGSYLTSIVYIPTLSELIEACGEKFVLHSPRSKDINEEYYMPSENEWTAYTQTERFGTLRTFGSTPEEAVANLWLELNKK